MERSFDSRRLHHDFNNLRSVLVLRMYCDSVSVRSYIVNLVHTIYKLYAVYLPNLTLHSMGAKGVIVPVPLTIIYWF